MEFDGITGGELQRIAHSLRNGDVPPDCYSCCHAGVLPSAILVGEISHPCRSKCSPAARTVTSGNTLRQVLTIIAAEFELICPGCSRPQAPGTASVGGGGGAAIPQLSPWAGLCLHPLLPPAAPWTRSVLSGFGGQPDPSTRPRQRRRRRAYESLQGRPEVGPLPTPRRCHGAGRRQVSPM